MNAVRPILRWLFALCIAGVLAGCATGSNPRDPWEKTNRVVFDFNQQVDATFLKPVAQIYDHVAPLPVRTGVSNVFSNVEDVWIGINNLLQGKPLDGLSDIGRFAINTTFGILGIFDVATELGLTKHEEDFGQTLAVWGVRSGPYLMLPFFGPRTLRDTGGMVVDMMASPYGFIPSVPARNVSRAIKLISERADLLGAEKSLDDAALDRYAYLRDFYLNRRESLIRDGRRVRKTDDDALNGGARPFYSVKDPDIELASRRLLLVELDRALAGRNAQVSPSADDAP
ncbi:VacJ family lipoprotein [Viridibacterium curvum]|uniref:VacJ family lipoprotein n=1 Tax=Viridibacterium curvum TaxID=1101404 RepID=A0ABP9Q8T6_9RHOO